MVPHVVIPSLVHGLGVFATKRIDKGTVVWRFISPPDYRMTEIEVAAAGELWQHHRDVYGYKPIGESYIEFPGDAALFVNHSSAPNCICNGPIDMVASRVIEPSEEILFNYFEFDQYPESGGVLT